MMKSSSSFARGQAAARRALARSVAIVLGISWLSISLPHMQGLPVGGVAAFSLLLSTTSKSLFPSSATFALTRRTKQSHSYGLWASSATSSSATSSSALLLSSSSSSATSTIIDCDVAVYGGGFGGLYAAVTLASINPNLDIVLIEPADSFVFLPLLYDLTIGTATEREVCPLYDDLLAQHQNIRQVRASLTSMAATTLSATATTRTTTKTPPTGICSNGVEIRPRHAAVVAVGASPTAVLGGVPGAATLARPFYTASDAYRTRRWLHNMDERLASSSSSSSSSSSLLSDNNTTPPPPRRRIAVVGGGYGGVELAACLQRRWNNNNNLDRLSSSSSSPVHVTLLSRGPPLANTRAAALVERALTKLGVTIENVTVEALLPASPSSSASSSAASSNDVDDDNNGPVLVQRKSYETTTTAAAVVDDTVPFDAVFWTAGSKPALPDTLTGLRRTRSGRLAVRPNLQCIRDNDGTSIRGLYAVGDCAETIIAYAAGPNDDNDNAIVAAYPKTASVALQQGIAVARNIQTVLNGGYPDAFEYRELGSLLTLGGPNAAVLAPKSGPLAPFLTPLYDVADAALSRLDQAIESAVTRRSDSTTSTTPPIISFGSHGLGAMAEDGENDGVLAGAVSGAIRRTLYAVLMPTNPQRLMALVSASASTTASLVKDVLGDKNKRKKN